MTTNRVPGFSEGYRLGQAFADMMFSNRGMVIAHRIPGRRRYSCEAIKGRPEVCARIEELLLGLDGFDSVRVSPVTGSVTAEYSVPEETADLVFDALSHAVAGKHALQEQTVIPTGIVTAGDNIYDIFRGLKKGILTFLDHTGPAFSPGSPASRFLPTASAGWCSRGTGRQERRSSSGDSRSFCVQPIWR